MLKIEIQVFQQSNTDIGLAKCTAPMMLLLLNTLLE